MNLKILLHLTLAVGLGATALGTSIPLATDRSRVQVTTISDSRGGPALKVLRTDQNSPLRAGTAWIWSKQWQEEPAEYYAQMRGRGLNAVRIILFDTWEYEAGYLTTDWNDAAYRTRMLNAIERAVNFASMNGMYVIINSHNKIPNYDVNYARTLWTHVAPYFKNRTNVIYEESNEALSGTGMDATGTYTGSMDRLRALRRNYDMIRSLAPDTHVMLLTPAGISGWGYVDGMARMTRTFENLPGTPIDWTKCSVAYHLYHADENLFPLAQNLRNFHQQYPGWPSENNFPKTLTNSQLGITDEWRSVSFGQDLFVTETTERLGLGWSHWNINRSEQLNRNFPFLWDDAVAKGYAWEPDRVVNDVRAVNCGGTKASPANSDINYFGGSVASNNPNGAVDLSDIKNPLPINAYRDERWGNFTYEFARLPVGRMATVRLHFVETWSGITGPNQRVFNVIANGKTVLDRFDIFAVAEGRNRAVAREFNILPDSRGRILLRFSSVTQFAKVDAIEVIRR